MINREEYTRRLEQQLKDWDARLDILKEKAAQSGEEVRQKFEAQRVHLLELREDAQQKLAQMKEQGEAAWLGMKDSTEAAWEKLADQFEKITSKWGHR